MKNKRLNKRLNKFWKKYVKLSKNLNEPIYAENLIISFKRKALNDIQYDLLEHYITSNLNIISSSTTSDLVTYTILLENSEFVEVDCIVPLFNYVTSLHLKVNILPMFNQTNDYLAR